MQHTERGPAQQSPILNTQSPNGERGGGQSPILNTQSPMAERVGKAPEKGKEKSIVERVSATVLDIGRDILTANEMAMDNFDRKSPFLVAAQGGATMLVGIGLEKVLDETFKKGMKGGPLYFGKLQIDIPDEIAKQIKDFEKTNPRLHQFILQSTKDLLTGTIYNGLAFFSRPMFESAKGEHLVESLAMNATEAMFTKGSFDYPEKRSKAETRLSDVTKERDTQLVSWKDLINTESNNAALKDEFLQKIIKNNTEINNTVLPEDDRWRWQTFLRQYSAFSNPPTLLGFDMLVKSMKALKDNYQEVRSVRKEKGIVGKKVEMPKKFEKKEWGNRDQGGRWQGNKDKVYYGKSNWKSSDQKAQEEYELKAA